MSRYTFVEATTPVTGQRAKRVAGLLDLLATSDGPLPFDEACEQLGIDQPSQLLPAMYALEFVGAVTRFTYTAGGTRARVAYQLTDEVEIVGVEDESEEELADGEDYWTWDDVKPMGRADLLKTIEDYGLEVRFKRVKTDVVRKHVAEALGVEVPS